MSIKLYVEGGGSSKALKRACRKGFRIFIEKAGLQGRMPKIVASGSRKNAYEDFEKKHDHAAHEDVSALLLVDAEGPVGEAEPWQHLKDRDGWNRPDGATDDQCHLMVEVMETWFLADRRALRVFYGQGYRENALPPNPQVEQIPKQDVLNGLDRAANGTTKGSYDKGSHSYEILAKIDPEKVKNVSPYANRLIETLFKFGGSEAPEDKDSVSGKPVDRSGRRDRLG